MPNSNQCKTKIQFVMKEGKWIAVDNYNITATEAMSRRSRIPIPYDPNIHNRHVCANKPKQDFEGVYRG